MGLHLNDESGFSSQSTAKALEAFMPHAPWNARMAAMVKLISVTNNADLERELCTELQKSLQTGLLAKQFAALRVLTCLYTVAPDRASSYLFDVGLLHIVLHNASTQWSTESLIRLAFAEMLCTASSHSQSRAKMVKAEDGRKYESEATIVELSEEEAEQATPLSPLAWLMALVERTEIENPTADQMLLIVGLLASLTLFKLTRIDAKPAGQLNGVASSDAKKKNGQREEADLLFELCKRHLQSSSDAGLRQTDIELEESSRQELQRFASLSALEGLSYLVMEYSSFRDRIADDELLLKALHALGLRASRTKNIAARYAFPQRGSDLASEPLEAGRTVDTAVQYTLVSLLATICASRPVKSKEEMQMAKLRRMANATSEEDCNGQHDKRLDQESVDRRIKRLIEADVVETLVLTTISSVAGMSERLNPSRGVRHALARIFLSLTAPQDKKLRGQIIRQGGAKALLALSNADVADIVKASEKEEVVALKADRFAAMQSLAQLLITEDPAIIFSSPVDVIRSLAILYMHEESSLLQRFEAALALTNVASGGAELAQRVARCSFPDRVLLRSTENQFVGADRAQNNSDKTAKHALADLLRQRILLEDNVMSRRSSLELLCNLLVVEELFAQWSGESQDSFRAAQTIVHGSATHDDRISKDLVILVALCGPAGDGNGTQEGGLKTRMAAGAVIATLCASASACARIFALGEVTVNKIARLIWPELDTGVEKIVEITEGQDEEEEEGENENVKDLHDQDLNSDPLGAMHAQCQLALRGLTAIECLVDFVVWLRDQSTNDTTRARQVLRDSGVAVAVKQLLKQQAALLKTGESQETAAVQALQMGVSKQAVTLLQKMQALSISDTT
jgi:hypothetical protein